MIDKELVNVALGRTNRLIVEAPPRHGKSDLISKWFPAWYLGTNPDNRLILTAYGDEFASDWGRKSRNLLEEFGHLYGVSVDRRSKASNRWGINNHDGGMITAGIGGQIVGRGCNVLIIDDPIKSAAEADSEVKREHLWNWFQAGAMSRLEPDGAVIILMQRWHVDDIVGRLKREQPDEWKVITLPAIAEFDDPLNRKVGEALWPERWPIDALERMKASTNLRWWNAQYQQQPSFSENAEWESSYFDNIFIDQFPTNFDASVLALDPSKGKDAKKGDYSAIVFVGLKDGTAYVNSSLKRRPITEMVEDTLTFYHKYRPNTLGIETNCFQQLLVPEFNRQQEGFGFERLNITEVENRINKNVRIRNLDPYLRNKELMFLNTDSNKLLVNQLKEFPLGIHDDGPDALAMAIKLLNETNQPDFDDGLGNNLFY